MFAFEDEDEDEDEMRSREVAPELEPSWNPPLPRSCSAACAEPNVSSSDRLVQSP